MRLVGQLDFRMDNVKTVYPPTNTVCGGGGGGGVEQKTNSDVNQGL